MICEGLQILRSHRLQRQEFMAAIQETSPNYLASTIVSLASLSWTFAIFRGQNQLTYVQRQSKFRY